MSRWRQLQVRTGGRANGKTQATVTELRRIVRAGGHPHIAGREVELCVTGECPEMRLSAIPPAKLERVGLRELVVAATPHAFRPDTDLRCTVPLCGLGPEDH